jgi:hypothetical protein
VKYFLSSSTAQDMPSTVNIHYLLVVFQNNAAQEYITNSSNTSSSVTQFVTNCENITAAAAAVATTSSVNYTCPDGQEVSHQCTDGSEIITTLCPAMRFLPVCRILSSNENDVPPACSLVSFTSTNVTCNCTMFLQQSSGSAANNGRRHLSRSSGVESSGYIEMVSMAEYSYEGFISTNSEVTEVSIGNLRSGLIVIVMFSVFWGCGLLGLYELFKSAYCTCCSKVQPLQSNRQRSHTNAAREVSLDTKKEYLLKYIDDILPTIFRSSVKHASILQSMWKTIRTYHPYAVVLTAEGPGAKEMKIQKGIYLLTIQAMLMFIIVSACVERA